MTSIKRLVAGAAAVLGAASLVQGAPADTGGGLEEVIVTAQKRSESEQSVPMSITTFSGAALEQKAINNFFDYATKVPNLAFAPTGDGVGTARTVSIRGISGDNVTGFYIDDTPLPDSIDPRVLDIDHIEVLRGPQGTLYGARSMGGTVRIITKEPDLSTFSASVHGGVSDTTRTDKLNYTADGIVNIPLIQDRLALRLTGFYDEEAGYFKRSFCTDPATAGVTCFPLSANGRTTVNNVAAIDTYGGAASLTFKASDTVTITPRLMMQRANYNGFPLADFNSVPGNGIGFPAPSNQYTLPQPLVSTDFNQARFFNVPEGGSDWWDLYSLTLHWKTGLGEFVSSTAYFDRRVDETEDESEFVWAAITSAACPTPAPYCNPPAPGPIEEIKAYQRFVEEARFASSLPGPVQFVVGAFYSDFHGRVPFAALYPPAEVPNLDNELTGGQPNNPDFPNLIFTQDYHTDIREPAVFGELSYEITKALKVTGGLRWYQVKTTSFGFEEGLATGSSTKIIGPLATDTESGTNPKVELDYHLAPDQMVYGLASKGFRVASCRSYRQEQPARPTIVLRRSLQSTPNSRFRTRAASGPTHCGITSSAQRRRGSTTVLRSTRRRSTSNGTTFSSRSSCRAASSSSRMPAPRKARVARWSCAHAPPSIWRPRWASATRMRRSPRRAIPRSRSARPCSKCPTGPETARCRTPRRSPMPGTWSAESTSRTWAAASAATTVRACLANARPTVSSMHASRSRAAQPSSRWWARISPTR